MGLICVNPTYARVAQQSMPMARTVCHANAVQVDRHNTILIWRALEHARFPSVKEPNGLFRSDSKRSDELSLLFQRISILIKRFNAVCFQGTFDQPVKADF